ALPASTELVLQFLGIDDPVLRRAEGFLDAPLVDLKDDFIARFESKFLRDLTRYHDAQGRSPSANTGSRSCHGLPNVRYNIQPFALAESDLLRNPTPRLRLCGFALQKVNMARSL